MPKRIQNNICAMIVAGGSGTRFWPLSTPERPKQFLTLFGKRSMLQETYDRVAPIVQPERALVVTGAPFVELVRNQLPEIPPENVIGEPMPRDTAAAMTLGSVILNKRFGDVPIIAMPADHVIHPKEAFQKTAMSAARFAVSDGAIYTLGIKPSWPSSSYGYLECGPRIRTDKDIEHFELVRFKEKPDVATAQQYLDDGRFYWNSGIFIWTPKVLLDEVREYLPEHHSRLTGLADKDMKPGWHEALRAAFEPLPKISIDFGVMEKSGRVRMIPADFNWNDIGGWLAIESFLDEDEAGNRVRGEIHSHNSERNIVFCEHPDETVALVGVKDLVVVRAGTLTLVVHKDKTEEVKKLVDKMIHSKKKR